MSLFYRALLQKRSIILRSLLIVATPYHVLNSNVSALLHTLNANVFECQCIESQCKGAFAYVSLHTLNANV